MSRSQKERERKTLANQSEKKSLSFMDRLNRSIFSAITSMILGMAVDEAGKLVFSVSNINTANRVGMAVQGIWNQQTPTFSQRIVRGLLSLFKINTEYFRAADTPKLLTENVENRVLRLLMQRYGYDTTKNIIIPNGYLAANLRNPGHALSVAQRINEAVSGKMPLKGFMDAFRQDFNRTGSPLSATYHYNRFARDLYAGFDRNVQNEYANQLGLSHAIYSHTIKNNTRDFCRARANRIYSIEKIDSWNSLNWQGKNPNADVKEVMGGYNCRGVWSWISAETAEQIAERRGIEIDTYN